MVRTRSLVGEPDELAEATAEAGRLCPSSVALELVSEHQRGVPVAQARRRPVGLHDEIVAKLCRYVKRPSRTKLENASETPAPAGITNTSSLPFTELFVVLPVAFRCDQPAPPNANGSSSQFPSCCG